MAKLRDERFICPAGLNPDSITCLDIITVKQLSNGACHSILFKLVMAILRNESSEALRRRYVFVIIKLVLSIYSELLGCILIHLPLSLWMYMHFFWGAANMPCCLAIFNTVSIHLIQMFQQQLCSHYCLLSKIVKIWTFDRCID